MFNTVIPREERRAVNENLLNNSASYAGLGDRNEHVIHKREIAVASER